MVGAVSRSLLCMNVCVCVLGQCRDLDYIFCFAWRRYLDRWEKVHYLGEEADRGSDEDEESRHKRWSARALHSVPITYNHSQHNVAGEFKYLLILDMSMCINMKTYFLDVSSRVTY